MAGASNALNKTNLIPKSGPGAAGFAVRKSDGRIITDLDGTQRGINTDGVITITANRTLLARESGSLVLFNSTTSLFAILPAPASGLEFSFIVKTLATDSGVGHLIKVAGAAEKVQSKASASGAALSAVAGKGVVNTYGTAVLNDAFTMKSDGTDWFGKPSGIWAVQA